MDPLDKLERFNRIMAAPAAYLIGTVMSWIFPFMKRLPTHPARLFFGTLVLFIVVTITRKVREDKLTKELMKTFRVEENIARVILPSTEQDFRKFGVQNPLDFCYVMILYSHKKKEGINEAETYLSAPDVYQQRAELCREMFGRLPEYSAHKDWIVSAIAEVKLISKEPIPYWDLDVIRRYVSPDVLERIYPRPEWERALQGYVREYGRILDTKK